MALIAMAVYDTLENKRTGLTIRTIQNVFETTYVDKHRLIVVDNGSCKLTVDALTKMSDKDEFKVIFNDKNLGTAEATNLAWKERRPGENAIKMDNDIEIRQKGWVDRMEEALARDPKLGIVGLKRKDCWENPAHEDPFYKSELVMLPHNPGEEWIVVEKVNHVMGTCQMYSSALLDKIGYLYQPKLYGFDDSFAAIRCKIAGFYNAFLPHIVIDHIDPGTTPYQKWKENHAAECWGDYHKAMAGYQNGTKSIYYNPFA